MIQLIEYISINLSLFILIGFTPVKIPRENIIEMNNIKCFTEV